MKKLPLCIVSSLALGRFGKTAMHIGYKQNSQQYHFGNRNATAVVESTQPDVLVQNIVQHMVTAKDKLVGLFEVKVAQAKGLLPQLQQLDRDKIAGRWRLAQLYLSDARSEQ